MDTPAGVSAATASGSARVDAITPLPSGSPTGFEGFGTPGRGPGSVTPSSLSGFDGGGDAGVGASRAATRSTTPGGTGAHGFVTPVAGGFGDATPPMTPMSPLRGFELEPSDVAGAAAFRGFDEAAPSNDHDELEGFDAELAL